MFRFEDPWVLGFLALIPAALLVRRWLGRRRFGTLTYSAVGSVVAAGEGLRPWARRIPPMLRALGLAALVVGGEGLLLWSRRIPPVLRALGLAALVVAAARPQTGLTSENVLTEGIDIVLVIDISTSMLAEDLEPNRLEAAKGVAAEFVAGRRNDRIGLVAFAGEAFTQVPLTLDYSVVTSLLAELDPSMIEDGTAVGMGLATAVKRLQASEAASKVVILLTDGRNNRGEVGPVTAARAAEALGVRVYTIGAGSRGTAPVPVNDPLRGRVYANMRVDIDEETLREVAAVTGAQYFRATDTESLGAIYDEIDQLERTEIEVENFTQYAERFGAPLGAGLLLLLLEVGLSQTVLRRLP